MGHIDPSTGRNRREAGRLHARAREAHEARQQGVKLPPSGGIRRQNGQPAEKRVTWRRRERVRRGKRPVTRDIAVLGRAGSKKEAGSRPAPQAAPVDWDQFAADEAAEYEKPIDRRWQVPGRRPRT